MGSYSVKCLSFSSEDFGLVGATLPSSEFVGGWRQTAERISAHVGHLCLQNINKTSQIQFLSGHSSGLMCDNVPCRLDIFFVDSVATPYIHAATRGRPNTSDHDYAVSLSSPTSVF